MMHLDGKALQWHQRLIKNQDKLFEVNWNNYIDEMRIRFNEYEYSNPMLEIVSLKHTSSVEEFYEEFESLLNLLQLPSEYALSIFINSLELEISKLARLFYPKAPTHALNIAKQLEYIVFNMPRKTYFSHKNPLISLP